MTNENETVDQVCEEMKEVTGTRRFIDSHYCNHCGDQIDGEGSALDVYSGRILAAHKREMTEKDEEILNLRKSLARVMEVTGDCRRCEECGDETCPWFGEPDGCNNREGRALFLAGKLVDPLKMKDAEISKLRALVGELTNAMLSIINCEGALSGGCDEDISWTCPVSKQCGIVLRAREAIGGGK